ncbi:hypothetical protein [Flavivirga eckloniae]|uniref:Uncharacterized protein n=1 Tax=Flavivirga eckloniae TaxID=1803846 RepID=A0A2K9PQE9_9FLAO|nr:hypothetical protein [Flavivirga eckloniae]AUP79292.1 hypothetical protein C1H87_11480 [Flavivirga eckloniae]
MKNLILLIASNLNKKSHWLIKKQLFSIVWCLVHATILSIMVIKVVESRLEFIWVSIILIYVSFYTIITNTILDIVIQYEKEKKGRFLK